MSTMLGQARSRVPRSARAAVERARLTVVPARRTRAPRMPFTVLVFGVLAAGVVGLLMFNTHMQQASFAATALQQRADALVAEKQSLSMELERLRDPQRLAVQARKLGMVAPSVPAFIRLSDGSIVGTPTVTTPEDAVVIRSAPSPKPSVLSPPPLVITVRPGPAEQAGAAGAQDLRGSGSGATTRHAPAGSNGPSATGTSEGVTR